MDNNINLNVISTNNNNTATDSIESSSSIVTNSLRNNLRISDILSRSRDRRRSREAWRRNISYLDPIEDVIEDPVGKFETNLGTFTSESDLFTRSTNSYNIYNKIRSQIDMKLSDFFNQMNNNNISSNFEFSLKPHIKFDELSVDEECEKQITKELGISLTEFEIYVEKYKKLINKYFKNVLDKEKRIKISLKKLDNLNKWVKRVQNFSLIDEDNEDNTNNTDNANDEDNRDDVDNTESEEKEELSRDNLTETFTTDSTTTPSTVEMNLLSGINNYVSEKVKDFDALKLRHDYEVSRKCFTKLINISQNINNIHQNQYCTICLSNLVSICLIPCGHSCCESCYNSYNENHNSNRRRICFVCRGTVSKTQKIYFTS